ncbi:MAG TPA: type II toxin-antitoxin system VapC family toxin [Gammaproteobacteria bacterium]|nr:type II toxin-antitoxin system VapC family toxin [Gammaproteobacteria bacterium]
MKRRIYVETSIPSFYFEPRKEADMVARRDWTRQWWKRARRRDELVTSEAVLEELSSGDYESREQCLDLVSDLPLVAIGPPVAETVEAYLAHQLMPRDPGGDALHLALASHFRCDFLARWNCRHLANANKFDHIRRVNGILGLFVPGLVTPLELLGDDDGL